MRSQDSGARDWVASVTRQLPWIYVLIASLVLVPLCLLTPPFYSPDEPAHAKRELAIADGIWLVHRSDGCVGSPIDTGLLRMQAIADTAIGDLEQRYPKASERPNGRVSWSQMAAMEHIGWTGQTSCSSFQNTAAYPPFLYLPQAVCWRLSRMAGLTVFASLHCVRWLDACLATLIGWLALRWSRSGRWLLFAYLLLPTLLGLMATCSQDAFLLTLPALAIALLTRAIEERRGLTAMELAGSTALLALCILSRAPYLPLAAVLLLPAIEARGIGWKRFAAPAACMLAVGGTLVVWQALIRPLGVMTGPGADATRQVAYLERQPLQGAMKIAVGTLRATPGLAIKGVEVLGLNDVFAPVLPLGLILLALAGIALLAPRPGLESPWSRGWLLAILLAVVAGISVAEYLIWTPVGSDRVGGLQSRYFLPLLPVVFVLWAGPVPWLARWKARSFCLLLAAAILLLAVVYTPELASYRFYGMGITQTLLHLARL